MPLDVKLMHRDSFISSCLRSGTRQLHGACWACLTVCFHPPDRPQRYATPVAHVHTASAEGDDALVVEENLEDAAILRSMGLEGRVLLELGAVEGSNSTLSR